MPVAIGVQHATLNWEDPSCHCGPARHTERRESQLIEEDDEGQEDDDEGGEGEEGEEGGEGGGEESDIKSNNPHLTGGEKHPFCQSIGTSWHYLWFDLRPANELADRAILLLTAVNRFDRQTVRGSKHSRVIADPGYLEMPTWKVQIISNCINTL